MIPTKESDATNDFIHTTNSLKTLNDLDWDSMLITPDNIKNMKPGLSQNSKDSFKNKQTSLQSSILEQSQGSSSNSTFSSPVPITSPISTDNDNPKKNVNLLELLAKKDTTSTSLTSSPPSNSTSGSTVISKGDLNIEVITLESSSTPRSGSPTKSPAKSERWAGAAFSNSPSPSSLPIPAFPLDESSTSLSSKNLSLDRNASPYKQSNGSNLSPLKSQMDQYNHQHQPFASPSKSYQHELPTKQPKPILKKRPTSPTSSSANTATNNHNHGSPFPSPSPSATAKQKQYVPKGHSHSPSPLSRPNSNASPSRPSPSHISRTSGTPSAATSLEETKLPEESKVSLTSSTSTLPQALLVAAQHHQQQYPYAHNQVQYQTVQGGYLHHNHSPNPSPTASSPKQDLDQLSNQLKMMLNICPVRS